MIHGYRNPVLDAAVSAQVGTFSHVMFGGLTHAPGRRTGRTAGAMAPRAGGWKHVFLADSGSVSVEVALKLAVQFQGARGHPQPQQHS